MSATQVKRRRGTSTENNSFTGAEAEITVDTTNHTLRVHDNSTVGGHVIPSLEYGAYSPYTGTATKVNIQNGYIVSPGTLAESDIPTLSAYVQANNAITAGTKCKVTYDTKGLVTAGADLAASDIPNLAISKITNLQTSLDNKQDAIKTVELDTAGSVTLTDNKVHYCEMTGGISFTPPVQTDYTVLHQMIVQLKKTNASWTVSLGNQLKYFGGVAPSISAAGYYNIYYEFDVNAQTWCVGAIYKGAI